MLRFHPLPFAGISFAHGIKTAQEPEQLYYPMLQDMNKKYLKHGIDILQNMYKRDIENR